jgi:uncharacterized surface protein with fasciclin (FAS1) repeats
MKKLTNKLAVLFSLLMVVFVIGCSDDDDGNIMGNNGPTMDIVETAAADGRFTTLLAAAEAADLVDALKGEGPLTVFAPTDDAFNALPAGTVEALLADTDALAAILLYHVVAGEVKAEQVVTLNSAPTLNGAEVTITITSEGTVMVDNANVIITDIETTNGVIHVIDAVIIPGSSSSASKEFVDSKATMAWGKYSIGGGWIAEAIKDGKLKWLTKRLSLYTVARLTGLNTLTTAVKAVDLDGTLRRGGPFTVFGPTEEAFGALPEGTIPALLADPAALTNILLYHVTEGKATSDIVVTLDNVNVPMVNGGTVGVIIDNGVMLDDTGTDQNKNVIVVDIPARNGVIHIIDGVLLP